MKLGKYIMPGSKKHGVFFVGLGLLFCPSSPLQAQEVPEYQLKAAFLYNFAKFVEWPQDAFQDSNSSLIVGILGEDPFGDHIDFIRNKSVKNRKLEIRHFDTIEDANNCHILFVSASEAEGLVEVLESLNNLTILTVSDMDLFIENGGIIKFELNDEKLGFTINSEAIKQADFKISSQLLKFGKLVKVEPKPAGD